FCFRLLLRNHMPSGNFFQRPAVMLTLALASVAVLVTLMGRLATGPQTAQKRVQLSAGEESEAYPAISPDGKRIAYSARESSKVSAFHVFVRELPSGKPRQLTQGEASDVAPVWSPDGGTLAFLRVADGLTQCIVIPSDGGSERKLAELGPAADAAQPLPAVSWNADGKSLVVVQSGEKQAPGLAVVALDSGKLQRITNPPEGGEGDSTPAVSPGGSTNAFVRHTQNEGGDIYICDATGGAVRRLTFDDRAIRGIAWMREGILSGHRTQSPGLHGQSHGIGHLARHAGHGRRRRRASAHPIHGARGQSRVVARRHENRRRQRSKRQRRNLR